jgi:GTP cyclohydrolase II
MDTSSLALGSLSRDLQNKIEVERALGEFRAARPVAVRSTDSLVLAFPVEGLTEREMPFLHVLGRNPRLITRGQKVRSPGAWNAAAAAIHFESITLEKIKTLTGLGEIEGALIHDIQLKEANDAEIAALSLANLSLLLPAVIVIDGSTADLAVLPILSVSPQAAVTYRDQEAKTLNIIARTFVPLDGVGRCEFVVFRGGDGFRDQIAVIVGDPLPERPVFARIHSACLTGDLFGSLKCDCGNQLRATVKAMSERDGGVVLYLDQEGRGNGIANKIRAYGLQEKGYDTYDADAILGFGEDQRRFDFAAEMLKQIGFTSVRLVTNNPHKIAALRLAGLDVVSTHRVLTRSTAHNAAYLTAKRDRGGHLLGDGATDWIDFEEVFRLDATQFSESSTQQLLSQTKTCAA